MITSSHYRKEIVACIYGAPRQDLQLFYNKCDQLISKITSENVDMFLVGWYNVNLLSYEYNEGTAEFVNDLCSHLCLLLIDHPMCTETTSTISDDIFFNAYDEQIPTGIIFTQQIICLYSIYSVMQLLLMLLRNCLVTRVW